MSMQAMARWLGGAKKVAPLLALLAAGLAALAALGLAASAASAATFSNNSGITIEDGGGYPTCREFGTESLVPGPATPYPSGIEVSGLSGSVSDVNVTLTGLSHTFPDDIGVLLVGPEGQKTILMTDVGGQIDFGGILTFDDEASAGALPDEGPLSSGTYQPTRGTLHEDSCTAPSSFPDTAPAGPYDSSLSVLNGSNPNGTWQLYVIDDTCCELPGPPGGSITGWSLDITVPPVNGAPVANDDSATTAEDTPTNIAVLSNDTDAENDALGVSSFTQPSQGKVTENTDGTLHYEPAANFNGTTTFTYTISDGNGETATATVTVTVTAVNDAPTLTQSGGACLSDTSASGRLDFTVNDVDSPLSGLTLTATSGNTALIPDSNLKSGGSGANRTLTLSAVPKRSGTAIVTVRVSDGTSSSTLLVQVTVGTSSSETITGTSGADVIFGLGGQGTLSGLGGTDLLCGGNGADTINGGDGNDVLDGGRGNDVLNGGADNDRLLGKAGADRLTGEGGADSFNGGSGTDLATDFDAGQGDTKTSIP